jgi:ketosteroid isomerase-like protein
VETQQRTRVTESLSIDPTRRGLLRGLGGGLAATLLLATNSAGASGMTEETARMAMGALNQALAIGDDSRLDNDFAPDVVVHPLHRIVATGKEVSPDLAGLKAALADIRGAATGIQLITDSLVAVDNQAAGRVTVRGASVGTAGPFEAGALVFMVIKDGRVSEMWFYLDPYAMMAVMAGVGAAAPIPSA